MKIHIRDVLVGAGVAAVCVGIFALVKKESIPSVTPTKRAEEQHAERVPNQARDVGAASSSKPSENAIRFNGMEPEVRDRLNMPVLDGKLLLTSEAISLMGLTEKQVEAINNRLLGLVEKYRIFEAEKAVVHENPGSEFFVYVPPAGQSVAEAFADVETTVSALTTEAQRDFFWRMAKMPLNLQTGYGGRLSKIIVIQPNPSKSEAKPYYVREMVLNNPPQDDFWSLNPEQAYNSGLVANQRGEFFKEIPERYSAFVEFDKFN